jgi:GNAT superfamily N-acetyltransferase
MSEAASYSVVETLRNGLSVEIRSVKPQDRDAMLSAVTRTSPLSLYRRFFGPKRNFTEREIAFFLDVDFVNHVALVALLKKRGRTIAIGGGRYVAVTPRKAEVAFAVVDQYQGQGVGAALMRHLTILARAGGFDEFVAEVLPENAPMLRVFERSGLVMKTTREGGAIKVSLQLTRVAT